MSVQGRIKIGYRRDRTHGDGIEIGLSEQFAINDMPDRLEPYYAENLPYSLEIFFRIRPSLMKGDR